MMELLLLWMLQGGFAASWKVDDLQSEKWDTPAGHGTVTHKQPESTCVPEPACTAIFGSNDSILWEEPKWVPVIEPAIQVQLPEDKDYVCTSFNSPNGWESCKTMVWTCADKSRILLTSEDQQHYCLTMKVFEGTR